MTKDEARSSVMGAISMALKDSTLQQGFEIICKNLSELEKENEELKDKLKNLSKVAEVRLANWQKYEEENKELKRQVEQKQHLADVRLEQSLENYKLFSDERKARIDVDIALDDTTDQLTYAKTIIQDLLDNTDEYARQKAEDFLQENNNEQART